MSKSTTTAGSTNNGNLLTHPQYTPHLRQEAQLRRQTLATFGPQGVLDLALIGAILGNNIREIGRYSVTCDGCLVRGRYTIYELVHFGALAVSGRGRRTSRRARRRTSVDSVASSTAGGAGEMGGVKKADMRIFPTTLSNLFPAMVFKAMRRKSVRPPKFQHDDLDDNEDSIYSSMPTTPTIFPMSPITATRPSLPESAKDTRSHSPTPSFASSTTTTTSTATVTATTVAAPADAMLITSEAVLSHLIQHRLHRVKDLPLPRELCFVGAVSLPLPPVLRAMHVAWTMDFLKVRATTPRRQRQQQQRQQQQLDKQDPSAQQQVFGGLEFRPDIYAHKMRLARLIRAQQQQQQEQKAGTSSSVAAPAPPTTTTPGSGYSHHRLSASMRRGPSSVSIPEENEDEDQPSSSSPSNEANIPPTPAIPLHLNKPAVPTPAPSASSPTATTTAKKSVRQDKRLMQQLLSLENKVPRIVRQWANVARTCFEDELIQEDRQVQTWVDRQRIQVILGCGYRFGTSATSITAAASTAAAAAAVAATPSLAGSVSTATTATGTTAMMIPGARKTTSATSTRPRLSPIATALANANALTNTTTTTRHQRIPSLSSSSSPAPRISCFPEGVRLGNSQQQQQPFQYSSPQQQQYQLQHQQQSTIRSRPTSATMNERLSASQQMLSMHLWLSLLVSPLSPEHMIQDQFGFLDS
ncbi:hypothetical protein EC991_000023 [Linnemannia zychae]|nr:hypothetical protein EC991_000023 [Linnemannia zychae]